MATITKIECDIKGCDNEVKGYGKGISIHSKFHTEQTEGRNVKPHFNKQKLDICEECMTKILDSFPLHGRGAQGYNDYWISESQLKDK